MTMRRVRRPWPYEREWRHQEALPLQLETDPTWGAGGRRCVNRFTDSPGTDVLLSRDQLIGANPMRNLRIDDLSHDLTEGAMAATAGGWTFTFPSKQGLLLPGIQHTNPVAVVDFW